MALDSGVVTVEDTATEISFSSHGGLTVLIQNLSGVDIFLGDSSVDTDSGFKLADGQSISYDLLTDDSVYGVVEADTADVRVTWLGR